MADSASDCIAANQVGGHNNMSLHEADHRGRALRQTEQPFYEQEKPKSLMTPARQAALAALEREFHDLLTARS